MDLSDQRSLVTVNDRSPDVDVDVTAAPEVEVLDALPVQPQAVVSLHPFGIDRRLVMEVLRPGETIAEYFTRMGLQLEGRPVVVRLSGARVPRELWARTRPRAGQLLEVQAVVEGDGAGQKVAGALLLVAAFVTGNAFLANVGFKLFLSGFLTSVSGWLFPKKGITDRQGGQASPTYSIAGIQNRARPYQPLPMVLGTHKMVPDYAARPYTEFEGEDQYLYAIFHFGLEAPAQWISDLKLGDTPLANYDSVTTQWGDAQGRTPLVWGNVDSLAGALLTSASYTTRTSSTGALSLAIDIEGQLFRAGDRGIEAAAVTLECSYRKVGDVPWLPFFESGFVLATSYWSEGYSDGGTWRQVSFDTNLAAGAHTEGAATGGSVPIGGDSGGWQLLYWSYITYASAAAAGFSTPNPWVAGTNSEFQILQNGTTKPVRTTYRRTVASGQYEVRMRRSAVSGDSRVTDVMTWTVLRTYQADSGTYTGQTRLAVKVKATGQLNGTIDNLNAIVTRPVWVDTTPLSLTSNWQLRDSSNPAWLFLFVCKGITIGSRLVFGMGLADAQIDYPSIRAWGAWCDTKGLTFNAVIDADSLANGELLDLLCLQGFASKTWVGGKLGVIYDQENQPIVGVVNMANILAGSFRVTYITEKAVDEVVCTFLNAANGYAQEEVRKTLPGVTNPRRTERIELFGCTSQAQAGRFANLRAAALVYRRKFIEWEQDAEGMIIRRGDVVALSHDMTQWGYSGRVVSATGVHPNIVFTLDRRVPANLVNVNDEWIGIRVPGETGYRILRCQCVPAGADNDSNQVTLVDAWPGIPLPGASVTAMDYIWIYDLKATPGYRVKIVDYVPRSKGDGRLTVQLRAVPETSAYYAAESGSFTSVAPGTLLDNVAQVSGLTITQEERFVGGVFFTELTATWAANRAYSSAEVTGSRTNGGSAMEQVSIGATQDGQRRISWRAAPGDQWQIFVRPYNGLGQPGQVIPQIYTVTNAPPPDVTGLGYTIEPFGVRLRWTRGANGDEGNYELRVDGASGDAATALAFSGAGASEYFWTIQIAGTRRIWVRQVDAGGVVSVNWAFVDVVIPAPAATGLAAAFVGPDLRLNWTGVPGQTAIREYLVEWDNSGTWVEWDRVQANNSVKRVTWLGGRTFRVRAIDEAGNVGATSTTGVTVSAPATPTLAAGVLTNRVNLTATDAQTTLPITVYEVRRGAAGVAWAAATVIGVLGSGRFASFEEIIGGTYDYLVRATDSAGNQGVEGRVGATLSDPPAFRRFANYNANFTLGTLTNTLLEATTAQLLAPFNTTETEAAHYSSRSWSTDQDKINAGYTHVAHPTSATGSYQEDVDLGTVVAGAKIDLTLTSVPLVGSVTVSPRISYKLNIGDAWTDGPAGQAALFVTNFRYVRYRFDFTSVANASLGQFGVLSCSGFNGRLSTERKTDSGSNTANSGDAGGTRITFNRADFDVPPNVQVSAIGTGALIAQVDSGSVDRFGFDVYVFNTSGVRQTSSVYWQAEQGT